MEEPSGKSVTSKVKVRDHRGLHLRLASEVCVVCDTYPNVRVRISRVDGSNVVEPHGPLCMLLLKASYGAELTVTCEGDEAEVALQKLCEVFAKERDAKQ